MNKLQAHQIMAELLYIDELLNYSVLNNQTELANYYDTIQQTLASSLDSYQGATDYDLLLELSEGTL